MNTSIRTIVPYLLAAAVAAVVTLGGVYAAVGAPQRASHTARVAKVVPAADKPATDPWVFQTMDMSPCRDADDVSQDVCYWDAPAHGGESVESFVSMWHGQVLYFVNTPKH